MERVDVTEAQIRSIVEKHTDIALSAHKVVHHHINTHVYVSGEAGEKIVIRICDDKRWFTTNESRERKFRREVFGWTIMGQLESINVPYVIALDVSKQLFPLPYLVISQVAGTPLSEIFPSLGQAEKLDLVRQFGKVAANIHSLKYNPDEVPPDAMRWSTLRESVIEDIGTLVDGGRASDRTGERVLDILKHHSGRLDVLDREQVFMHGDYAFRNVLVERDAGPWKICGLVDAELSGIGYRNREFWNAEGLDFRNMDLPGFRDALLEGYGGKLTREDYKLAYLMGGLNPGHLNEKLVEQLDSASFSPDLDWLDIFG